VRHILIDGRSWSIDEEQPLGSPGAFGAVYVGADDMGQPVAVKRLHVHMEQDAVRELQISQLLAGHRYRSVIPIPAAGTDPASGHTFIVMAKAEESLADYIARFAPVAEADALAIIANIAEGLFEIGDLIHRDLKPANVLKQDGRWKIADLGLARFVEASTSLHTMKDFLSAPYAAPEQWRGDRVTKRTDLYALGCILYALRTGLPPFLGQTRDEFAEHHLHSPAPDLAGEDSVRMLAFSLLSKEPNLRPAVSTLLERISRIQNAISEPKSSALTGIAAELMQKEAVEQAQRAQRSRQAAERAAMSKEAGDRFFEMMQTLKKQIVDAAPNIDSNYKALYGDSDPRCVSMRLADGIIRWDLPYAKLESGVLGKGWDAVAGGMIEVCEAWSSRKSRSANLWFARIEPDEEYRWWEACYTYKGAPSRFDSDNLVMAPFSIGDGHSWAGYRLGLDGLKYWFRLAHNPVAIDTDFDEFRTRWIDWFAQIARRQLEEDHPDPVEAIQSRFRFR